MKNAFRLFAVMPLLVLCMEPARAETAVDAINKRLGVDLNNITIGESLRPRQNVSAPFEKQSMQFQAPMKQEVQVPSKMELQAPSKVSAAILPVRKVHLCTLIPGRARRLARREDRVARQSAAMELRLTGRTLLENPAPMASGRTVMESGACSSCTGSAGSSGLTTLASGSALPDRNTLASNIMPVSLTSLTTRELLEGGQITQQKRTVNEPGICGGGGSGGGRRGLFGRR